MFNSFDAASLDSRIESQTSEYSEAPLGTFSFIYHPWIPGAVANQQRADKAQVFRAVAAELSRRSEGPGGEARD